MEGFQLARPDAKGKERVCEQTSRQKRHCPGWGEAGHPSFTSPHLNFLRLHLITTLLRLEEVGAEQGWGDQWVIQSLVSPSTCTAGPTGRDKRLPLLRSLWALPYVASVTGLQPVQRPCRHLWPSLGICACCSLSASRSPPPGSLPWPSHHSWF